MSSYSLCAGTRDHRTGVEESLGDAASVRDVDYGYDDLYRLTRETIWQKNAADELVIAWRIDYAYDKVGNRERMTVTLDDLEVRTTVFWACVLYWG